MYPLGVLFGLGFDTSSEIALLGISSVQAAKGTSIWVILIFPVLFTAAMCLLDTADGALMMTLYTSTALAHDQIAVLYYSIVLTVVTVVVAVVVGVIQLLNLILNVAEPEGRFWDGVRVAGDHYDAIGRSPPRHVRSYGGACSATCGRRRHLRIFPRLRRVECPSVQALAAPYRSKATAALASNGIHRSRRTRCKFARGIRATARRSSNGEETWLWRIEYREQGCPELVAVRTRSR